MKIKDLSQNEIEAMSYDDLAFLILEENGKKMKINDLFKKVCKLMKLDDNVFETKIADFFELLSTDRKFIMLENGYWDLRDKHSNRVKIENDDEDQETTDLEDLELDDDDEEEEEDIFYENDESDDDEDDLKDLVLIDEDEEEANS